MKERRNKSPANPDSSAEEIEKMGTPELIDVLDQLLNRAESRGDAPREKEVTDYRRNILRMPAAELRQAINQIKNILAKTPAKESQTGTDNKKV